MASVYDTFIDYYKKFHDEVLAPLTVICKSKGYDNLFQWLGKFPPPNTSQAMPAMEYMSRMLEGVDDIKGCLLHNIKNLTPDETQFIEEDTLNYLEKFMRYRRIFHTIFSYLHK
jgi:hypothetical protein